MGTPPAIFFALALSSTGFSLWNLVLPKTNPQAEACATGKEIIEQ
jgi:hypothetical protein